MEKEVRRFYRDLNEILAKIPFITREQFPAESDDEEEGGEVTDVDIRFSNYAEQTNLAFNILLVKFGARPSTFSYGFRTDELLMANDEFIDFISKDGDLGSGFFYTEDHGDFVIYNRQYEDLYFRKKDIRNEENVDIHYVRGLRLGFPCPKDFRMVFSPNGMLVDMYLVDERRINFYFYACKYDAANAKAAVDKWTEFERYANMIGKTILLEMRHGRRG